MPSGIGTVLVVFAILGALVVAAAFVYGSRTRGQRAPVGQPIAAPGAFEARRAAVAYSGELAQAVEAAQTDVEFVRLQSGDVAADRLLTATNSARDALDALTVALGQTAGIDIATPGPTATAASTRVEGALLAARRSADALAAVRADVRTLPSGPQRRAIDDAG